MSIRLALEQFISEKRAEGNDLSGNMLSYFRALADFTDSAMAPVAQAQNAPASVAASASVMTSQASTDASTAGTAPVAPPAS